MFEITPNQVQQKRLRCFFNSNAMFSNSGYGQQMAELLPHIRDEGYPTAICNFYGQAGTKFMLDGILQYPVIQHVYGSDAMVLHARDFKADVTFSLQDVWVLHPNDLQQVNRFIPILPVDHDPIPKAVLEKLKFAYKIVALSKFAKKQLADNGLYSTYIPHTVNTELFKPIDKVERKKAAGLPDGAFVFGMVSANKDNPPRKSFQEVLDAFKMFLSLQPNSFLYIHTNPQFPGGFPIDEYAGFIGIKDKVLFPDTYQMNYNMGKQDMSLIMNTFDCLLSPSSSEGFAVPIIEAMSCGVPVITTDFTAMSEHIEEGKNGFKVKVAYKRFSGMGSYIGIPDVLDLYNKMVSVYKTDRKVMGENARKFALDNYSTEKVFKEKWIPLLSQIEKEVYPIDKV